jgi:hypothetical protein
LPASSLRPCRDQRDQPPLIEHAPQQLLRLRVVGDRHHRRELGHGLGVPLLVRPPAAARVAVVPVAPPGRRKFVAAGLALHARERYARAERGAVPVGVTPLTLLGMKAVTAAVVVAIAIAAASFALYRLAQDEERFGTRTNLNRIGGRALITRGEPFALVAWKSTRGLCTSLVFAENEVATRCGMPVVGAPRDTGGPDHLVVGGSYQRLPDDDLWFDGVAAANVSRVEVELTDGRRLEAPVYDAPATLGLDLKFFLARTRPPEHWPPKIGIPEPPVRAFSAYDEKGGLLERFAPAAAS